MTNLATIILPAATTTTDDDDDDRSAMERILNVVQRHHERVTAGMVAQELGISVNDAGAELCAILAAVGSKANFRFEQDRQNPEVNTMVFSFPSNVTALAHHQLRRDSMRDTLLATIKILVKVLKIITAFGLILSLLILTCAALCAVVAVLVVASRGGASQHQRSQLARQLRALIFTMRELLWCYAVFGPNDTTGHNPFMREVAYDLWLTCSVCCGNPTSIFYWFRANQLSARARHRGFSGRRIFQNDIEGVSLIRRGEWNESDNDNPGDMDTTSTQSSSQRGLLRVATEYLFGPDDPDETHMYWKLRAAAILHMGGSSIAMPMLAPYASRPPSSLADKDGVLREAMAMAAFFNGVPSKGKKDSEPVFSFPELVADPSIFMQRFPGPDQDEHESSWKQFLCAGECSPPTSSTIFPPYLHERMLPFSRLQQNELFQCIGLGVLNAMGVVWFGQSLLPGGPLELTDTSSLLAFFLLSLLLPTLRFYAVLFFALPTGRMLVLMARNMLRNRRNRARRALCDELSK